MEFELNSADFTDLPDILELLEALNLDMEDVHYSAFAVVRYRQEVIGAGRVRMHEEGTLELCSLGVLEEFRGKGAGKTIVEHLLEQHAGKSIWVVTEIPLFFSRFGFSETDTYSEAIEDKLQRCRSLYACSSAIVMSRQA